MTQPWSAGCRGAARKVSYSLLRSLTDSELEKKLPKLRAGNYKTVSKATGRYNCLAFANKDQRHWWQAGYHGGRYRWPEKTPDTLDGWTELFVRDGYVITDFREIEVGFEKVAIYIDFKDMLPGHVAFSDGTVWKSKLGRSVDIEHSSLDLLEGDQNWEYGIVERVLKRPVKSARKRRKRNSHSR